MSSLPRHIRLQAAARALVDQWAEGEAGLEHRIATHWHVPFQPAWDEAEYQIGAAMARADRHIYKLYR
jgi:hypothetical protein